MPKKVTGPIVFDVSEIYTNKNRTLITLLETKVDKDDRTKVNGLGGAT